jgi:hypothetical protein
MNYSMHLTVRLRTSEMYNHVIVTVETALPRGAIFSYSKLLGATLCGPGGLPSVSESNREGTVYDQRRCS